MNDLAPWFACLTNGQDYLKNFSKIQFPVSHSILLKQVSDSEAWGYLFLMSIIGEAATGTQLARPGDADHHANVSPRVSVDSYRMTWWLLRCLDLEILLNWVMLTQLIRSNLLRSLKAMLRRSELKQQGPSLLGIIDQFSLYSHIQLYPPLYHSVRTFLTLTLSLSSLTKK